MSNKVLVRRDKKFHFINEHGEQDFCMMPNFEWEEAPISKEEGLHRLHSFLSWCNFAKILKSATI